MFLPYLDLDKMGVKSDAQELLRKEISNEITIFRKKM